MYEIVVLEDSMKKIVLGLLAISSCVVAMDVKVKMPSRSVLLERLGSIHMAHFAESTKLVNELAGQQRYPFSVVVALNLSIYDYHEFLTEEGRSEEFLKATRALMNEHRSEILGVLSQDFPKVLSQLRKEGFYKPIQ